MRTWVKVQAKSYPFLNETVLHTFVSFISFATTKYSFLCFLLLNLNPRSITLKEINNLIVNVFACAQFNGLTGILGIENSYIRRDIIQTQHCTRPEYLSVANDWSFVVLMLIRWEHLDILVQRELCRLQGIQQCGGTIRHKENITMYLWYLR